MAGKPDFIVDPSGNVKDVRHLKYQKSPGVPTPNASGSGPSGPISNGSAASRYKGNSSGTPGGIILIPIGLIITILIILFRLATHSNSNNSYSNNTYSEEEVSDLNLGNMYYAEGKYDQAIVHFNLAISSSPGFGEAYNSRGLAYDAQGNYDLAIADFNKAIEIMPDWAGSYNNRGSTYFGNGEIELALADLDKAIQLDTDFAKAFYNRGLVNMDQANYSGAIADFDKAIEFTPEDRYMERSSFSSTMQALDAVYTARITGQPYSSTGEADLFNLLPSSLSSESELYQTWADLPMAYANRGLAFIYTGDYERAAVDLNKALELGPDSEEKQWVEFMKLGLP